MRISDWSSDVCSSDLNKLVQPGAVSVDGTPIDLRKVNTPSYVQAGREDHIAPPESVWKVTEHFAGPLRFVLAGSGHIAGVVNPPAAGKYQHWICEDKKASLDDYIAHAKDRKSTRLNSSHSCAY